MDKKKQIYNAEVMALPPLRLVLGEIPTPDPDWRKKSNQQAHKRGRDIKVSVKRIIAHLEED
jgi:hypothetical protein